MLVVDWIKLHRLPQHESGRKVVQAHAFILAAKWNLSLIDKPLRNQLIPLAKTATKQHTWSLHSFTSKIESSQVAEKWNLIQAHVVVRQRNISRIPNCVM